jgi:predicted lipase
MKNNNVKPYKTTLEKSNAYWMATFAREVYKKKSNSDYTPDETSILQTLKNEDNDFLSVKGVSKNSAQAALIEHKNYFCMAFRGTDEVVDWLDNINAFRTQVLFGDFHRGFWNSLNDIWQELYERYQLLKKTKHARPIFLTGHSLGGAMATMAAAKLVHEDLPFTSVYTFGQPRAMSRETSRIFNMECKSRFFRFQNNNDIVTRIPARVMGYSHVGTYIYISEEGELHNDPGFWFRFLDYLDGAVEAVKEDGIDAIADHDMTKYVNAIKKWDIKF